MSKQYGILNNSQRYRPPRPVTGIALVVLYLCGHALILQHEYFPCVSKGTGCSLSDHCSIFGREKKFMCSTFSRSPLGAHKVPQFMVAEAQFPRKSCEIGYSLQSRTDANALGFNCISHIHHIWELGQKDRCCNSVVPLGLDNMKISSRFINVTWNNPI
jgi:hypothetical protein